jgi:phosphate transport system permease protein
VPLRLKLVALRGAAAAAGTICILIAAFVVIEAWPALESVGPVRFFTDESWHPAGGPRAGRFDFTPMIIGTLAASSGALLLAAPLGVASAIFSGFYAPRLVRRAYRRTLQLLAGIPSVVYGLWGLMVLAPLIRQMQPPGQSLLAAVLILALMILPTIALLSESALRAVPRAYLEGAAALGLSRWATVHGVALPAARGGIASAILLAAGRAIGETMAVLMVAGNVVRVPRSLFDPVRTLAANIAFELGYALEHHRSALFASGLALMGMIAILVAATAVLGRKCAHA